MAITQKLQTLADLWLRQDKNPSTKKEISDLLASDDSIGLEKRLANRIEFGTAGLRARMGAGYSRMNDLTVIQTTQGLVAYLLSVISCDLNTMSVVIGHDHRYNSERFAKLTAGVFLSRGIKVYLFRQLVHTPMVPFTVTLKNATCGIMITASHNPKDDNGYKLYWSNGSQIIPPIDSEIAESILKNLEPWVWDDKLVDIYAGILCFDPYDESNQSYFDELKKLKEIISLRDPKRQPVVTFAYTAMHGVGASFATKAFEIFDLPTFITVDAQNYPDPSFPTVKFPNPEEPGALDLAQETADRAGANIVFANDPDADRLAVAEKTKSGWHIFHGNQIGILLAAFLLHGFRTHNPNVPLGVLTTTVSSNMLSHFANSESLCFRETLTGFKWLGNSASDLINRGVRVFFAYEEAIGFMCGDMVKDKDGISALACFAELACWCYERGTTVVDWLNDLYIQYGYFATNNSYVICNDPVKVKKIFDKIRYSQKSSSKPTYPTTLDYMPIISIRDLTIGYDSSNPPGYEPTLPISASSQMITFKFAVPNVRPDIEFLPAVVTLRTSGTEPKVKWYAELPGKWKGSTDASGNEKLKIIQRVADEELRRLVEAIRLQWLNVDI